MALNKVDLVADRSALDGFEATLRARGCRVRRISGATGEGSEALLGDIAGAVEESR